MTVGRTASLALIAASIAAIAAPPTPAEIDSLKQHFQRPPDDARIMMRWWWFGPAVTKPELEREMRAMKDAGIGGVEIQPVYPLELDNNVPFLSPDFLDALHFTSAKARELGLRVDLTLGSGWPYGGPQIPATLAAGRLRYERIPIPPGAREVAPPPEKEGEKLIAAFVEADGSTREIAMDGTVTPSPEPRVALFFFSSRTGMLVKRAAAGAEGYVLDHYDRAALDHYLQTVGEPLLKAFGPNPPYAIFCDSLEVYGSDWTSDLLEEFQKRRGYDLKPHLPALIGNTGPETAAIRDDWGLTLTELAEERFLSTLNHWATRHGTRLRAQAYGTPPVALSSNLLVDLPEGEGSFWNRFTATRWATSAAHLFGRPVVSAETWTWLHSPAFRATPLDMKAEADQMFLQGVNQIVGHGWPYSPDSAGEPGWRFYAAGALNEHNPWWIVMPDLTAYLQRISYLLRQGRQVNDVALYLPSSDARAQFAPGRVSLSETLQQMLDRTGVIPQILEAGFNFDFVDDKVILDSSVNRYPVIVLPDVQRMPPKTRQALDAFVRAGGTLIATGHAALAPSLLKAKNPDVALSPPAPAIGFVHRTTSSAGIYFLANTGNAAAHTQATFRLRGLEPEWWDAFTGAIAPAAFQAQADGAIAVALDLEPYESRILVFVGQASRPAAGLQTRSGRSLPAAIDLSAGWTISFAKAPPMAFPNLHSWADDPETKFYSGRATYRKTVPVRPELLQPGLTVYLDFGEGTPVTEMTHKHPGTRAWLESPVREAAIVYVNGQRAGAVWRPPYRVDVTHLLHPGDNAVEVIVGNLAINAMAGSPPPDYSALIRKYGKRFDPQDMDNLKPLPSGLLGPIRLIATLAARTPVDSSAAKAVSPPRPAGAEPGFVYH